MADYQDTFDRANRALGSDWDASTFEWPEYPEARDEASVECTDCGNVVILRQGEAITRGDDPRLCRHMARMFGVWEQA